MADGCTFQIASDAAVEGGWGRVVHIASHRITPHLTALHCATLRRVALHHTACTTLHHTTSHRTALHHTASHCVTLHCSASHRAAPHCTTWYHIALHHITLHRTAPHHTTPHLMALHCIAAVTCSKSAQLSQTSLCAFNEEKGSKGSISLKTFL